MKKVLVLEDDKDIAELERDFLKASDFDVTICADGVQGMKLIKEDQYDAIVLDLMLPGKNGIDICLETRSISNVPIIMVTARKEDIDKIKGLSAGADDYVVKPFSAAELVVRVKAHISIHERMKNELQPERGEKTEIGELTIWRKARRVSRGEREIVLTNKEFEILDFFLNNPGIVFSKETLYDRIWGEEAMGDLSAVTVQVNRLREKIEDDPEKPKIIQTVWGIGYRFCII